MATTYWFRASDPRAEPIGPLSRDELASRLAAGGLPRGGTVASAEGPPPPPGGRWSPADALLDAQASGARAGAAESAADQRARIAANSAYTDLRLLLGVVNVLAILGTAAACVSGFGSREHDAATALGQSLGWIALLFAWWIGRGLATAFLDLVDHSLQQRRD